MPTSEILAQSIDRLSVSTQPQLPHEDLLRRLINRHRAIECKFPDPKLLVELTLPPYAKLTSGGEAFLSYDSEDHNRIMMFNTAVNAQVMITSWFSHFLIRDIGAYFLNCLFLELTRL